LEDKVKMMYFCPTENERISVSAEEPLEGQKLKESL
jgi:hypothetical protein